MVNVKFGKRLRLAAARASFHCLAHPFDINIDIDMDLRAPARPRHFGSPCPCEIALSSPVRDSRARPAAVTAPGGGAATHAHGLERVERGARLGRVPVPAPIR